MSGLRPGEEDLRLASKVCTRGLPPLLSKQVAGPTDGGVPAKRDDQAFPLQVQDLRDGAPSRESRG